MNVTLKRDFISPAAYIRMTSTMLAVIANVGDSVQ